MTGGRREDVRVVLMAVNRLLYVRGAKQLTGWGVDGIEWQAGGECFPLFLAPGPQVIIAMACFADLALSALPPLKSKSQQCQAHHFIIRRSICNVHCVRLESEQLQG